jgi:hypothetical protein
MQISAVASTTSTTTMVSRTMRLAIVLISAFAVTTVSASSVVPLTLETLERDVLRSREPWMVSLTADADKCPACEMIEKEFAKASATAGEKLGVKFGSLNVLSEDLDMEKFESLVRLQQLPAILAYPTHATEKRQASGDVSARGLDGANDGCEREDDCGVCG